MNARLLLLRCRPLLLAGLLPFCAIPPAVAKKNLPDKVAVLAAIDVIEAELPDPVSTRDATALVARFAAQSSDVIVTLSGFSAPWALEDGGLDTPERIQLARAPLYDAYIAGCVKFQLEQRKVDDNPYAGWLLAIRVHERFPARNLGVFQSIRRLARLEEMGFLAEYADIVKQGFAAETITSKKTPVPAKERLSRDHLAPARELLRAGKFREVYALYDAWLAQNPHDADVLFDRAYALILESGAAKKNRDAKAARKAARPYALKAAVFGSDNPLLEELLIVTDPKSRDPGASAHPGGKKAGESMARGAKAFAQRRYDDAREEYTRALQLDPGSYTATLYIGDCYYAQGDHARAIPWFEKAIALDPNRETAHRYMADALRKSGRPAEAVAKHIDALIAEPANKLPRSVMQSVAQSINPLFQPSPINKIPMGGVSFDPKKKEMLLGLDPETQSAYVTVYLLARGAWLGEHAAGHFPQGAKPRHCAAEEMAGLSLFSKVVLEQNENKDADASEWLAAAETIRRLEAAGLLEAFVYIDRMTDGIAQDYPAYRKKHRDLLARYIREFWLGESPPK